MQQNSENPAGSSSLVDRYLPPETGGARAEGATGGPAPGMLSISTIRAILWRQRLLILGVVGVIVALGIAVTMLMTSIYEATATVRVNPQGTEIIEGAALDPYITANETSRHLQTLAEVIRSRNMALKVVDSLELTQADPASLGGEMTPEAMNSPAQLREDLADYLMAAVEVTVPPESRILSITARSSSPEMAARIANAYVENFLLDSLTQGIETNSYARDYIEDQIAETRERLRDAEQQAIQYARANRIVGDSMTGTGTGESGEEGGGTAPTITVNNLSSINNSYMQARTARIAAEQRWRTVSGIPAAQLPEVRQSATIQSLRAQLAETRARRSNLMERYQEDYPEVRELTAQIGVLSQQVAASAEDIKRGVRADYQIAVRQEEALQRELNSVSDQTLNEQDRRVQYSLLEREADVHRGQLDSLLQRFNQLTAASNIRTSDVNMLDRATVPTAPSSPSLLRNLAAALVVGLGLAAALAILREAMDDRLRSTEDVERKLGTRVLGQTPYISDEVSHEIADFFSPISEAYASIRATLDYQLPAVHCPVIQFTSSQSAEGKTTSAVATARKYASIGRRVLLIDMDLRRPAVAGNFLDARPKVGVVEAVYMHVAFDEAVVKAVEPNLDLLPVGTIPDNPTEILSSGLVAELIGKARTKYDVIIIDSSPVMGIADAPLLSRFVDAVVFIVEANRAQGKQARVAIQRLRDVNANVLGAVLTKYRALEAGESYDYQYRYYTYDRKTA